MAHWKTVLVTGGAGYIGSHTIVELQCAGYDVIAIDNFANSVSTCDGYAPSLQRVEMITKKKIQFYKCDLLDLQTLDSIFLKVINYLDIDSIVKLGKTQHERYGASLSKLYDRSLVVTQHRLRQQRPSEATKEVFRIHKFVCMWHDIDCVIHFAAMKAVGESMQNPLLYHKNNLIGTINLLETMRKHACYQLVFSSSCTIYGNPTQLPITEKHPIGNVTNVYGKTKYFIEEILKDLTVSDKNWNIISLRYFNPVGAHPSGLIGEDPTKPFSNLMPFMAQVAIGKLPMLQIFGGDYETIDGTGVRDYIHVMDLATGHVAALAKLKTQHLRLKHYNLGTGKGTSVLQLLRTFEKVTKTSIPFAMKERRDGDIVSMYANATLAQVELGWSAKYTLEEMCEDFWRWQTLNPDGYKSAIISKTISRTNGTTNGTNDVSQVGYIH